MACLVIIPPAESTLLLNTAHVPTIVPRARCSLCILYGIPLRFSDFNRASHCIQHASHLAGRETLGYANTIAA